MFVDSRGSNRNQATKAAKKERAEHPRRKAAVQANGVLKRPKEKPKKRGKGTKMLSWS